MPPESRSRWRTFCALCIAVLMVSIDGAMVNIALPPIKTELLFSDVSLVWVLNAYLLTFSGFVLLSGRLADLFGHRRLFLLGIALFTAASAACGLASTRALLVGARAIQGLGAAIVASVSLSLTVGLFTEPPERSKAMGIYSFVSLFAGAFGFSLGGTLTSALGWRWIFLINLPLGAAIYAFCRVLLPEQRVRAPAGQLDIAGAITITGSSVLTVYAIVNVNDAGWNCLQTIVLLAGSLALLLVFHEIETRVAIPLVPLGLFRRRNLLVGSIISMLWAFTVGGWTLIAVLYLQVVLKCSPEQVGFAFLPSNLSAAAISLGCSAKLVARFGIKRTLFIGLLITAGALALLARAPVRGSVAIDVLPAMFLDGVGSGLALSPILLAATSGTSPAESGLVSGIVSTAGLIASTLGVAILVATASAYSRSLVAEGMNLPAALDNGYHLAFWIGATLLLVAALATSLLRIEQRDAIPTTDLAAHDSSASV